MNTDDHLDRMLADLDENAAAPADTTVRNLHAELATLADDLRQPLPADPHADESALRRAVAVVRDIGRNPSPQTLAVAAVFDDNAEQPEVGEIGPYKLLAKLGQGGMGTVYKALHTRLEKVVALKVLPAERMASSESVARFNREMKAVGKLEHPHIVRATDAGEADGKHYLVMEYVEGIDLAALLKRNGPLPIAAACELVRQAALGLQAAHSRGMVHRDVKPANLMLARQEFGPPVVKVLDLGLALLSETHSDGDATGLTSDGHIMGTIDFMAPEQAGDSHAVDARADVYSLGATLYALLTGGSIFAGRDFKTVMQKLSALANESAPPLRDRRGDVPEELAAVVDRMLARDPADRFATPADVAAALEPFAVGAELAALLGEPAASQCGNTSTIDYDTAANAASSVPDAASVRNTPSVATGAASVALRPAPATPPRSPRTTLIATACLFAVVTFAVLYFTGVIFKVKTPDGTLVVEVDDPKDVVVEIDGQKANVEVTADGKAIQISLAPGTRQLVVKTADGTVLKTEGGKKIEMTAGKMRRIRAWLEKPVNVVVAKPPVAHAPGAPWKPTAEQQAFFDAVAQLPADLQVAPVAERLKRLNPEFDGKLAKFGFAKAGRVIRLSLPKAPLRELWPLAALTTLEELDISHIPATTLAPIGRLTALRSLNFAGVDVDRMGFVARLKKLETLDCSGTWVRDLSPLSGLPLKTLRTFGVSAYNKPAVAVFATLPKLETINGLPLKKFLARRDEVERLRTILPAYSAERQLALVVEKLKEFNPGFNGRIAGHEIKQERVTSLSLHAATQIVDLSPVAVLPLTSVNCNYTRVSDLSPLKGMKLTELHCSFTRVSDLSPLKGMPLTDLRLAGTRVSDLSPLQGMPLTSLRCAGTSVADLSPLSGMQLTMLNCSSTRVSDLTPLKGMPLTILDCVGTRVSDLSPLKGMRLKGLDCYHTRVSDLSPLHGMPLTSLRCAGTSVADLSPLSGMQLTMLNCSSTRVSDLSPLKGMKLTHLNCTYTGVSDLSPLKGMPLTSLDCYGTRISDLSPLKGMPLKHLYCAATRVSDLSPLKGTPLERIYLDLRLFHTADEMLLRSLPLERIAEFWKAYELRRQAAGAFAAETAKLPAGKQVATVVAKLKQLNGNKVGALGHVIENDAVIAATLVRNDATYDVTPLRAFTKLKKLTLTGGPYWLDISAVNSLPLEELTCSKDIAFKNAPVLRGMQTLTTINGQPAGKYLDSLLAGAKGKR